jgi:hypothetical protein
MTAPAFTFTQQVDGMTVLEVKVSAEEATQNGQTGLLFTFATTVADGYRVDLNGFFLDIGGDGGLRTQVNGASANNMRGGNNDGYDYAIGLGSVGGNDADFTGGSGFIADPNRTLTLDDLVGADAGLRATSFGLDGQGSLKLVADYTPPPPPPQDNFPDLAKDISNIVFYFKVGGENGVLPTDDMKPSPTGDGFFTVKIDTPPEAIDDLDAWFDAALARVIDQTAANEDTLLYGVHIKSGLNAFADATQFNQDYVFSGPPDKALAFFAIDGDIANEPLPTPLTAPVTDNAIDATVAYDPVWHAII